MIYLTNQILLYLLGAAAIGIAIGWLVRHCTCNRALTKLRSTLESKINLQATELDEAKKQAHTYKTQYGDIKSKYIQQAGDLMLMTSRWQTTLKKAKQLPLHQTWIRNLQQKYIQTLSERNEFENLACQYVDMHADANQKIKRLNKRVTDQESFKFRLNDMIGKVHRLNDKATSLENDIRGLYGMIGQIQNKWKQDRKRITEQESLKVRLYDTVSKVQRLNNKVTSSENNIRGLHGMIGQVQSKWKQDRLDTAHMREIHPTLKQQASSAKAELHTYKNKSQTEITGAQNQRNRDLAEQNTRHQTELIRLQKRIDELTPLETPNNDNKFNRFMDKVRLVGTSKNNVLGRTYKQINQIKLESSQKERVFVDTCEEKDAVIEDLREQVRTAENRALASSAAQVQEYKAKLTSLEGELQSSKLDLSMLREHEHTIEALKKKLKTKPIPTLKRTRAKLAKKKESTTVKAETKPSSDLKKVTKSLSIADAKVKDDLQAIKGIGAVMEGKLNNFGVYSYEQLGRLKAADIEILANTLGNFPGRIDRDKWVSQSKNLYKKKYDKKLS